MKIINLTPHTLNLYGAGGALEIPPSGELARVKQTDVPAGSITVAGVTLDLTEKTFGEIENLPEPQEGVIYVVSGLVVAALDKSRPDVWAPGTAKRDPDGRIVGAIGLSR